MRCLLIGICQANALYDPVFSRVYSEIVCYQIYMIDEKEMLDILDNILPTCDLVLSQPVSDNYRDTNIFSTRTLKERTKDKIKHFIITNCYFTGYDPLPFQTTDFSDETMLLDGVSYFPAISFESLLKKDFKQAAKDWCNPDAYSREQLQLNYDKTIESLKEREKSVFDTGFEIDIKIADYIEKNYTQQLLFHTYNHPTNSLLTEICRRIMAKLDLFSPEIGRNMGEELLGENSIPPCPCVYNKLSMKFTYTSFVIKGKRYSTHDAMKFFITILEASEKSLLDKWLDSIKYNKSRLNFS